jgi:creatinine amidohydrolase
LLTFRGDYFRLGSPAGLFDTGELALGIHGGEVETSLTLHLRPDLVRRAALKGFTELPAQMARDNAILGVEEPVGISWMSQDLNRAGVVGNAAGADAERGSRLLSFLVDRFVILLREIARTPLSMIQKGPLRY